jgi:hypothetical protein
VVVVAVVVVTIDFHIANAKKHNKQSVQVNKSLHRMNVIKTAMLIALNVIEIKRVHRSPPP